MPARAPRPAPTLAHKASEVGLLNASLSVATSHLQLELQWPASVAQLSHASALKATSAPQPTSRKSAGWHAKSTNESPGVEGSGDGYPRKFRNFLGGS